MSAPSYTLMLPEPSTPIEDIPFVEEENTQEVLPIEENLLEEALMFANNMVVQRTNELADIIAERDRQANGHENQILSVHGYEDALEEAMEFVELIQSFINNRPP